MRKRKGRDSRQTSQSQSISFLRKQEPTETLSYVSSPEAQQNILWQPSLFGQLAKQVVVYVPPLSRYLRTLSPVGIVPSFRRLGLVSAFRSSGELLFRLKPFLPFGESKPIQSSFLPLFRLRLSNQLASGGFSFSQGLRKPFS